MGINFGYIFVINYGLFDLVGEYEFWVYVVWDREYYLQI